MLDQNPIYDFLKSNKLTDLDEKSFVNKYSAPDKAKEIHSFFVENKLTDLDSAGFYDKYLKKKVGGEEFSPTKSPSREYLSEGQELADKGFIKTEKLDPSQLVSQYRSPDISLTPKPKKNYYSDKLEKGLIFDKEGKLYEPSSEALTKAITPAEEIDLKKSAQKDLVEQSREMAVVEEEPVPIEKQGWLLNMVSALDKGFAKNFISSPIKGLGTVLQGATKKVMGGTGEGFISNKLIQYGDYLNKAIDELTPQDEEFKNTLWDQAAQALGQVGSLVFTGGLTGAAGKGAALVSQAPKGAAITAAKTLGSQLSSPTAVSAGLSMGQAEFDRAKEAGATDDQAFEAFYKNALTGSVLETIPVMQFFKRFNNSTGGSVANYIKTKGVAGITGGIEEMTTEVLQQLYSNKTAKDIYNINQDILDGVGSSGGVGFGVGFLLNAMGANAKILRKQGRDQEATVLENQVKQYEDNLENPKVTSGNKVSAKDIVTQGVEVGTQKAVKNLDRDLANNVITPEQYQEGMAFAEKAAQVADKIPETVTGESRVKSIELLVERNDINQANQNLLQQKQTTDVAYHAGIDEEIKANEERIKKLDSEVYNIAKKPSKEFGTKKYIVDGEEVSQEAFEALQGKPIGTKKIIEAEVKPTEVNLTTAEKMNASQNRYGIVKDGAEAGFIVASNPENNVVKIKGVTVNEELRGKNIAGDAYVKLGESLAKEGVSLESDSFDKMEPSATRVWEKLADKGLAVKGENSYQFKPTEVKQPTKKEEVKIYNAKDLKSSPEILKEDKDYYTLTYPKSFVSLFTNMFSLKNNGFENAKIGDVINIFKKDYVIEGFMENKKNPNETKVKLIRVDKDGNLLREKDLSKKEQKQGKAKEFEEEEVEVEEPEQITKDDVKKAEAKFAAAEDRFKKARNKIEATQVKQAGMFGGEQKGMFAMGGEEAKSTLDPLRKAAKEAKAELDDIRNRIKVQEVAQPELAPVESKSDEDFVDNKIKLVKEQGRPLSEFKKGDKVSWASDFNDRWKQYSEGVIVKTGTEYEIERFSNNPMFKRFKTFRLNSGDRVIMKPSKEANYTGEENIEKKYKDVLKAKQEADKKQNRQIGAEKATVTKEIYRRVNEMDAPADAEQVALRYLADGGTVSKEAVDEAYGSVKRAELNVKRRVSLSEEVKSKDFVQGNETLDQTAHRLWQDNKQKIPESEIKDKLMAEIGNNNSRLEAAEAYLDKYNAEYKQEKEELRLSELYKEQYLEEQAEIEKELRKPLDEQIEGEASEEHINNLINQYEAEIKGEDQQLRPESEGDVSKEASKRKVAEKTSETELAKEYKEVVGKASKKAKENAKKEFVDRNFDNIVEKLKIQIKCPT